MRGEGADILIDPLGVKQVVLFVIDAVAEVMTGSIKVLATAADVQPVEINLATTL